MVWYLSPLQARTESQDSFCHSKYWWITYNTYYTGEKAQFKQLRGQTNSVHALIGSGLIVLLDTVGVMWNLSQSKFCNCWRAGGGEEWSEGWREQSLAGSSVWWRLPLVILGVDYSDKYNS